MTLVLAGIAAVELAGITAVWALCHAAARRPAYGPPVATTAPTRRTTDPDHAAS